MSFGAVYSLRHLSRWRIRLSGQRIRADDRAQEMVAENGVRRYLLVTLVFVTAILIGFVALFLSIAPLQGLIQIVLFLLMTVLLSVNSYLDNRGDEQLLGFIATRSRLYGASSAVILADENGTMMQVSPSAAEMLGYTREELEGRPIETLIPPDLRPRHRLAFRRVKRGRGPHTERVLATTALHKDGTLVPVDTQLLSWNIGGKWVFSARIIPMETDSGKDKEQGQKP